MRYALAFALVLSSTAVAADVHPDAVVDVSRGKVRLAGAKVEAWPPAGGSLTALAAKLGPAPADATSARTMEVHLDPELTAADLFTVLQAGTAAGYGDFLLGIAVNGGSVHGPVHAKPPPDAPLVVAIDEQGYHVTGIEADPVDVKCIAYQCTAPTSYSKDELAHTLLRAPPGNPTVVLAPVATVPFPVILATIDAVKGRYPDIELKAP